MPDWLLEFDAAGPFPARDLALKSWPDAESALNELAERREGTALLREEGDRQYLFLGVEGDVAVASFNPRDPRGTPREKRRPIVWALPPDLLVTNKKEVAFNLGNTETDLPAEVCIDIATMLAIAKHYYHTKALLETVTWKKESELPD